MVETDQGRSLGIDMMAVTAIGQDTESMSDDSHIQAVLA